MEKDLQLGRIVSFSLLDLQDRLESLRQITPRIIMAQARQRLQVLTMVLAEDPLDSRTLTERGTVGEKGNGSLEQKETSTSYSWKQKQTNMYIKFIRNLLCTWRIPEKEHIQGPVKLEDANSSIGTQPRCHTYASCGSATR